MKTKRFAPKDAKIIRENEGATPDQLLELGLSSKAYHRLVDADNHSAATLQPIKVEKLEATKVHQPDVVQLHNRKSGRVVRMGYRSAKMLSQKYPEEFTIL